MSRYVAFCRSKRKEVNVLRRYWLVFTIVFLIASTAALTWYFKSPLTQQTLNLLLKKDSISISCLEWNATRSRIELTRLCISTPQANIELTETYVEFKQSLITVIQNYSTLLESIREWPNVSTQALTISLKRPIEEILPKAHTQQSAAIPLSTLIEQQLQQWQNLPRVTAHQVTLQLYELKTPLALTLDITSNQIEVTLLESENIDKLQISAIQQDEEAQLTASFSVTQLKQLFSLVQRIQPTTPKLIPTLLDTLKSGDFDMVISAQKTQLKSQLNIHSFQASFNATTLANAELTPTLTPELAESVNTLMTQWKSLDPKEDSQLSAEANIEILHQFDAEQTQIELKNTFFSFSPSTQLNSALLLAITDKLPAAVTATLPTHTFKNQSWRVDFPQQLQFEKKKLSTISGAFHLSSQEPLLTAELSINVLPVLNWSGQATLSLPLQELETPTFAWKKADFSCSVNYQWNSEQFALTPQCQTNIPHIDINKALDTHASVSHLTLTIGVDTPITVQPDNTISPINWILNAHGTTKTAFATKKIPFSVSSQINIGQHNNHIPLNLILDSQINSKHSLTLSNLPELTLSTSGDINSQTFQLASWKAEVFRLLPLGDLMLPDSLVLRSGHLTLSGDGNWNPKQLSAQLNLSSNGVTGELDGMLFANASQQIAISMQEKALSFSPMNFEVGLVDSGILASNIKGAVAIATDPINDRFSLFLQDMKGEVLGGNFSLSAGAIYPELTKSWDLKLDELSLAELVPPSDKFKITVSGKVSGDIPIELLDTGPIVKQGRLRNISNGEIRIEQNATVTAIAGGNEQVTRGMNYLSNLQFTELRCEVSMTEDATVLLKNHVVGRNPDLDQAIELNYNHEQNFFMWLKLLRDSEQLINKVTNQ